MRTSISGASALRLSMNDRWGHSSSSFAVRLIRVSLSEKTPIAFSISGKNWVNNHAHVISFENKFTRRFVEYYFNSISLEPYITGGAQPKLNQENLNRILIPIPPLAEQERIVSILDRFEALTTDLTSGLPAEIKARQQQYEYYRDQLLTFKRAN